MPPSFGDTRPTRATFVALALGAFILLVITAGLATSGGFAPLLVILPLYLVFALWLFCRRRVTFQPATKNILITRTLFGRALTRRIPFAAITGIESRGCWARPRGGGRADDGTPEGDAHYIMYDLVLRRGRRTIVLAMFAQVDEAERLAHDIVRLLGVPAQRRDYARRADGLPVWQRGARTPIA